LKKVHKQIPAVQLNPGSGGLVEIQYQEPNAACGLSQQQSTHCTKQRSPPL